MNGLLQPLYQSKYHQWLKIHKEVLHRILHVAYDCGLYTHGLTFSPIKGMEGNIEFLGYFKKYEEGAL